MALFSEQVVGRATGCIGMGGTAENIRLDSVSVAHFKFLLGRCVLVILSEFVVPVEALFA